MQPTVNKNRHQKWYSIPTHRPNVASNLGKHDLGSVETMGLEPTTSCLQSRRSSRLSYVPLLETEDNAPEQTGSNPFEPWGCNQQASYKAN